MTELPANPATAGDDVPRLVPEAWPPADPIEPVPTRGIHWLLALPATLPAVLCPRRMGPHLASSSWSAAYVAHFLSAAIAVGAFFAFVTEHERALSEDMEITLLANPLVELRRALAGAVLMSFAMLNGWPEVIGTVVATAVVEVSIWLAALLLIPLHAAGEGARRTYFRSVKLLLWSSACQIPILWLFIRLVLRFDRYVRSEAWAFGTLLLLELWWLSVLIRLGGRYGGPKEGPRWEDRRPRCETCGYSLTSLPPAGRCPECAAPVHDSLPQRRGPPAFVMARGLMGRAAGFARTTWQAIFAQRFASRVSVWSHHRAARVYALLMCGLIGVISSAASLAALWWYHAPPGGTAWWEELSPADRTIELYLARYEHLAASVPIGIGAGLGALAWMLLVGLFLSRSGFRDMADRVVILCYSTAWLLVPVLLGIAGNWSAYEINERWGPFRPFRLYQDAWVDWHDTIWLVCLIPAAATLVMSFRRVHAMLRQARFANA